ncbi:glycoside hydrolase family 64 protein [Sporormia fimetaria CBS 119925]|uniref:Glycoside hydrolase family 64 protein n=1 Tax=Sporormia fimetaria CBS 119925 TaxID=1340428 RepID=A0A6A6UYI7_9PLEO|nr:glycoside hydrolase family 64 protein [Sporormia fimetaria CBS 119925]
MGSFYHRIKDSLNEKLPVKFSGRPSEKTETSDYHQAKFARIARYGEQPQVPIQAPRLTVALKNRTSSSNVYAYITGRALDCDNAPVFIQSDAKSLYFPESPCEILSPVMKDVGIKLGAPGNTVQAEIPRMCGGRIWFSVGAPLIFRINPGPAVVEPSITNQTDPNFNTVWDFVEFTYNEHQLFANITWVDMFCLPLSISLTNTNGNTQTVQGMPASGMSTIVNELKAQAARDNRPWDKLIYYCNDRPHRIISPNQLMVTNAKVWGDYWTDYVQKVWARFTTQDMIINTQAAPGNVRGRVVDGKLNIPGAGSFLPPKALDIFTCSTGPFITGSNQCRNAVIPRLAAAFNRTTLLQTCDQFPNGSKPIDYYKNPVTNHYSRILHQVALDGRGYTFPYDDVVPDGGEDVAGVVHDGCPKLFTIGVGGG